jgi:SulP family sulfate permease
MKAVNNNTGGLRLPVLQGVLPIKASLIPLELIAGLTLAALAIPEVMGYTKIAGTPVITGLYTMLIPMALFALFGSSRHLVVGAIRQRRPCSPPAWWGWRPPVLMNTWRWRQCLP